MNADGGMSTGISSGRIALMRYACFMLVAAAVSGCAARPDRASPAASPPKENGYAMPSGKSIPAKIAAVAQRTVTSERAAYLGRAQHVCTPSGFGRTSRCFLR